jgi:hypothetical protein
MVLRGEQRRATQLRKRTSLTVSPSAGAFAVTCIMTVPNAADYHWNQALA